MRVCKHCKIECLRLKSKIKWNEQKNAETEANLHAGGLERRSKWLGKAEESKGVQLSKWDYMFKKIGII